MKTYSTAAWVSLLSFTAWAGDFINLDFDSPDLSHLQTDPNIGVQFGTPQDLVPGWAIAQSDVPIDRVWYSNLGTAVPVTLSESRSVGDLGGYVLQYTGSSHPSPGVEIKKTTLLSQQGTIPANAVGLKLEWTGFGNTIVSPLYINGQQVAIFSDPQRPQFFEADISPWAGQEVQLSLYFPAGTSAEIDELAFVTVPEPSTWALLGVGLAALGWQYRRRR